MPEGYITLTSNQPVEPRRARFARGERVEQPPPTVYVTLPGMPPRKMKEIKSKT